MHCTAAANQRLPCFWQTPARTIDTSVWLGGNAHQTEGGSPGSFMRWSSGRHTPLCAPLACNALRQEDLHERLVGDVLFVGERLEVV